MSLRFALFIFIIPLLITCYAHFSFKQLLGKKNAKLIYLFNSIVLSIPLLRLIGLTQFFPTGYYTLMGFVGSVLFFLIVKDIARLLFKLLDRRNEAVNRERRDFLKRATLLGMGGAVPL